MEGSDCIYPFLSSSLAKRITVARFSDSISQKLEAVLHFSVVAYSVSVERVRFSESAFAYRNRAW